MNLSQKSNLSDSRAYCMDDRRVPLTDLLAREEIRLATLIGVLDELRVTNVEADDSLGLVSGSIEEARAASGLAYNAETRRYGQKDLEDRILKRCRLEKFYYSPWR